MPTDHSVPHYCCDAIFNMDLAVVAATIYSCLYNISRWSQWEAPWFAFVEASLYDHSHMDHLSNLLTCWSCRCRPTLLPLNNQRNGREWLHNLAVPPLFCCWLSIWRWKIERWLQSVDFITSHNLWWSHSISFFSYVVLALPVLQYSILQRMCECCLTSSYAPCGLRGCKNRPASFPGRMSFKATKPGSVCLVS